MDSIRKTIFVITLATIYLLTIGFCALGAEYPIGSGNNDWWTTYPDQSSESGNEVRHPQWVLEALENKPVMIYVHKSCSWCLPQTEAIDELVKEYGDKITYFNLSAEESDMRTEEAGINYDPDGGPISYVPLTIILTLAPNADGQTKVIWKSTDQVTGKDWIKSHIEDAINYHNETLISRKN
ncbi:MAG: thioredoxin family protein [Methanotrichaceae archaeon]|nr:thioredoxin family protein [Methanotrichaceae archaeon]